MRGFNKSSVIERHLDNHDSTLILLIELNMVAREQGEPLGHDHYPFYPKD